MKKIVSVLLVVLLVLLCVPAMAEDDGEGKLDLSSKTVDELLNLQDAVSKALYQKGEMVILPTGIYVVGRDIAAGNYLIKTHSSSEYGDGIIVNIYKTEQAKAEYESAENAYDYALKLAQYNYEYEREFEIPEEIDTAQFFALKMEIGSPESLKITLEEGQILECSLGYSRKDVRLTIEKYGTLFMN